VGGRGWRGRGRWLGLGREFVAVFFLCVSLFLNTDRRRRRTKKEKEGRGCFAYPCWTDVVGQESLVGVYFGRRVVEIYWCAGVGFLDEAGDFRAGDGCLGCC
jgi:hypothetical protein